MPVSSATTSLNEISRSHLQSTFELSDHAFKMSGRLDQSLDSIIDSQKKAKREGRHRKVGKRAGVTAPVGGIKKTTKPVKSAIKPVAGATSQPKSSKIVVSGLVR